jgi:uncharacterized repeat protein (TIGR03803 family)
MQPRGTPVFGADGALYGTAFYGGVTGCESGCGAIWRLAPSGSTWKASYFGLPFLGDKNFNTDGIHPTAGLVVHKGILYGINSLGGNTAQLDFGTVFTVAPPHGSVKTWTVKVLYRFNAKSNGGTTPIGGITFGADGLIYGTTSQGGSHGHGTVFKMTLAGAKTTIANFTGANGDNPQGDLAFGKDGAIYGTTFGGGKYNRGTVFRMAKSGSTWKSPQVLHSFTGGNIAGGFNDGNGPMGHIVLGSDGSVYGTTQFGGPLNKGTVFRLKPSSWTHSYVHQFGSVSGDGKNVVSGVTAGPGGMLYGTTTEGGRFTFGTLFRVAPTGKSYKVLHSFAGGKDGSGPKGGVVLKNSTVYGTASEDGGVACVVNGKHLFQGCGTVFKVVD